MRNIFWVLFLRKIKPSSLKYVVKTRFIILDSSILYTFSTHTLCKVCSTWDQYPCNKTLTDQHYCQRKKYNNPLVLPLRHYTTVFWRSIKQGSSRNKWSGGYLMMELEPGKTNQGRSVFNVNSALHGIPTSEDGGLGNPPPPPKRTPPTGKFL